jgi:lipopolysaccharide transport system ATP-binding protein
MSEVSNKEGRTVLFVSHQMGTIAQLCEKSILLQNGKVVKSGNTKGVIDYYMSSASNQNKNYTVEEKNLVNKECYFTEIQIKNGSGELTDQFKFNENIKLEFKMQVLELPKGIMIGIGLQDKYSGRVSTFLKPLSEFFKNAGEEINVSVTLPESVFAPNNYSFVFALFQPGGRIIDFVENVCPIRIIDNGTQFAIFEGLDYGNIIIETHWQER